jgi:hypothetical protein
MHQLLWLDVSWNAISFTDGQAIKDMAGSLPEESLAKELAQKVEKNPELLAV